MFFVLVDDDVSADIIFMHVYVKLTKLIDVYMYCRASTLLEGRRDLFPREI